MHLASYVLSLANAEDPIAVNASTFRLNDLKSADLAAYLIEQ